MLQPLQQPAAWIGDELFRRDDWLTPLSAEDCREIEAAQAAVEQQQIPLEQISPANFPLPTLASRLTTIGRALEHSSGAALIKGLPVARFSLEQAQRVFWGLTSHLGTAVSQSAQGERLFSVRDAGYADNDPRSRGPMTRKELTFHSDRCDVIAFLCLQTARSGGENDVVSSVSLYNRLLADRPDLLQVLMQPFRYQRHNVDSGNALPYYEQPVFSFYDGYFAGFLMQILIERAYAQADAPPMTPEQREALAELQRLAGEMAARFRQEQGDLVLLNNLVTLHRRTAFEDDSDADRRRHILRIWLATPDSRPLDPAFAPTFGNTAAGSVRGGMRPLG